MAVALEGYFGAETGGLDEVTDTVGSPTADSAQKRSGSYSYKLTGTTVTAQSIRFTKDTPGVFAVVGFGFRWNVNLIPTSDIDLYGALGGSAYNIRLRIKAVTGNLVIVDANNVEQATVSAPFAQNTWYYVELYCKESGTIGEATLFIDSTQVAALTNQDFSTGTAPSTRADFTGSLIVGEDIWIDDHYHLQVDSAADRLGPSEVLAYQTGNLTATSDLSNNLDTGVWNNAGKTPLETATTRISFTGSPDLGSVYFDDAASGGRGPGPSGGAYTLNGTLRGAKYCGWFFRGTGGGSTHSMYVGNNTDGVTARTILLGTSAGWMESYETAATIVPSASEVFAMGFGTGGAQDVLCDEMWAMVLHTPPVAAAAWVPRPVIVGQARQRAAVR